MKYLFKKYWMILLFALIINVPIFVLGITRTNYSLTLKGDTTIFNSVVSIDTENEEKGSFSSIYVMSISHSTLLQNIICEKDPIVDINEISSYSSHITDIENCYQTNLVILLVTNFLCTLLEVVLQKKILENNSY